MGLPVLRLNSNGESVKNWQRFLDGLGFLDNVKGVPDDGNFGAATDADTNTNLI